MKTKTITLKKLREKIEECRDTSDYALDGYIKDEWDDGYDACLEALDDWVDDVEAGR